MFKQLKQDFKYHPAITAAIFIAITLVWSKLFIGLHMDVDMGWLLQCLDRFIAGGTYTEDFYETNPPLSFLMYLPAYPLYTYLGIDAQISVLLCFMAYLMIANITLYKMLTHDRVAIIAAFFIAQTWAMGISFGTKDHLIFIFLPTLCLFQYLITIDKKPGKCISIACIIMGGIAIALKPHFAIIPAAFFAHRLYTSKSIVKCISSIDFIGLLIFGVFYLIFITLLTPSFWDIFPIVTSLYSIDKPFPLTMRLFYLGFAGFAIICSLFIENKNIKAAIYACAALSILCLFPYLLQNKGFHYHALPLLGFGMTALFLGIYGAAKYLTPHKDVRLWLSAFFIAMLGLTYVTGGQKEFQTEGQFLAQPLVDTIDELAWNRSYATYDFKAPLGALPYMTDLKNGSRFGQIWALYGLSQKHKAATTDEEKQGIKKQMLKQVDLFAEDMKRYKPSIITIPQYKDPATGEKTKNYYNFLIQNENFKKNMQNYIYEDTLDIDISFVNNNKNPDKIVAHDVFVLKKDHDL